MWDEHSLRNSAPLLFRFGIGSVWKIFEIKDQLINESISDGGDCRTAPATPGLLITHGFEILLKYINLIHFVIDLGTMVL